MYHINRLDHRVVVIIYGIILSLLLIAARLFYLQVTWKEHYSSRGKKNFLRIESTYSQRGNIVDRYGTLLATNRPKAIMYWQGSGNKKLSGNQINKLHFIETILKIPILKDQQLLSKISYTEKQYRQFLIATDLTVEQLSKIEELFPDDPNLLITAHFERYYPHQTCASHILGYLGKQMETPSFGQMGLEKICEKVLRGEPGTIIKTTNSVGRDIAKVKLKESSAGDAIHTTIDFAIQNICETIFPPEYTGTMIVMDPEQGDILGLVSRPTFDPSLFLNTISFSEWHALQEKKPFINRALNPYPPGSIFKLVTISAALEHGIVSPDQIWNCKGFVSFAKRKYWCHKRWGHDELDTMQAVAQSCNILFYEIGKKIDIDLITQYAYKFGLGSKTGFLFPEGIGIIPSREWKLRERGEQWWPGETLSVTIGQSFLLATPLQIIRMVSSIFTGNLVKPRILLHEDIEKHPLTLQKSTIDFLQESMRFVVTHGTGKRVNAVKDIEIYAKTSTAQTSGFQHRKRGAEFLEHAWFVGYFTYQNNKPLAFLILIENAGTSLVATSVAKKFLIAYKNLK